MGVKGLWRLLLPIGRRISIETLEGKILAIDASIWLTQFVKAMRDPITGKGTAAAHLIGFFRRLCRLRFHRIKPVFVFDGATPEIKQREVAQRRRRREQFAVLTDGSVQRMARQLLQDALQKQQQIFLATTKASSTNSDMTINGNGQSGFVAGFNPGSQGETSSALKDPSNDGTDTTKTEIINVDEDIGFNDISKGTLPITTSKHVDETNDWDLPLAAAAAEEAKEMEDDESYECESDTEYEEFNTLASSRIKNKFRNGKKARRNGEGFSVEHVSSLPPVQRKDAVEQAQRDQRLQSRKEFMPAAANPMEFSNVQLKNFLKSCKLNKNIVAMAKCAAIKDNHGVPGEGMASDGTTRVELIRENESGESIVDPTLVTGEIRQSKTSKLKKFSECIASTRDSSDEEDWGDSLVDVTQNRTLAHLKQSTKRLVVIDDADDVEKGNRLSTGRSSHVEPTNVNLVDEHKHDCLSSKVNASRNSIDLYSKADAYDSDEVGGFMAKDLAGTDDFVCSEGGKQLHDDYKMAQRLQDSEDRDGPSLLQSGDTFLSIDEPDDKGNVSESSRKRPSVTVDVNMHAGESTASEEEAVDWEDGSSIPINDDSNMESKCFSGLKAIAEVPELSESSKVEFGWNETKKFPSVDDNSDISKTGTDAVSSDIQEKFTISKIETGHRASKHLSPETSAALIQAQSTAENLTNWAGRAFRRAMKEAGGDESSSEESIPDISIALAQPFPERASDPEILRPVNRPVSDVSSSDHPEEVLAEKSKGSSSANEDQFISLMDPDDNDAKWALERNRRERDMDTITDEMLEEAKQLLLLFGVPYVEAPTEAEAQCVTLEQLGLVDGIVTEDSDVFVFGGRKVYKNIFDEQKYAEVYAAADAEREMKLGRNQMVALAMLLGGDYTEGIKGVGIVNAMEILETFDVTDNLREGLIGFRKWLDGFDPSDGLSLESMNRNKDNTFHSKHWTARTRWVAPSNFPADNVIKAYIDPVVDKSKDKFSWGGKYFSMYVNAKYL